MSGKLPERNEVSLLICEDARFEVNNKVSLLGAFLGNSMKVKDVGEKFAIPITFLLCIGGGEGKYEMKLSLNYPSGKVIISDTGEIPKLKNRMALHVFKIMNMQIIETGSYKIDFVLDGQNYPFSFEVEHDPTLQ